MKQLGFILMAVIIWGCQDSEEHSNELTNVVPRMSINKKVKRSVSISYITDSFSPENLVFEEKVIRTFDTSGNMIDMKQYIIDSTILYQHNFQKYHGDTLLKLERGIGNVFKPKIETDTLKFLNDLIIERTSIRTHRIIYNNGVRNEVPIPTQVLYEYDEMKRLISSTQYHDQTINKCSYTYNENDQLTLKECSYDDTSKVNYIEKRYYNKNGLKNKQIESSYKGDSITSEYKRYYKYDTRDSLIYQSWYINGRNFLIYNYKFNEKGQKLTEYIFNDSSGDSTLLAMQNYYYYDEKGNLKMSSIIGVNGDPMRTMLYSYDNEDNLIEERRFNHTIDLDKRAVLTRLLTKHYYEYY